jgi:hypothetical protein
MEILPRSVKGSHAMPNHIAVCGLLTGHLTDGLKMGWRNGGFGIVRRGLTRACRRKKSWVGARKIQSGRGKVKRKNKRKITGRDDPVDEG